MRYERRAKEFLVGKDSRTLAGPWFRYYRDSGVTHVCQPDALLLRDGLAFVFEMKSNHSVRAYWQLRHLYGPVIQAAYPDHDVRLIEVTRTFDPLEPFPEDVIISRLYDDINIVDDKIGVLIWRP